MTPGLENYTFSAWAGPGLGLRPVLSRASQIFLKLKIKKWLAKFFYLKVYREMFTFDVFQKNYSKVLKFAVEVFRPPLLKSKNLIFGIWSCGVSNFF